MMTSVEKFPKLNALPVGVPRESAVEIEVSKGILIFRVSKTTQERIENLLAKQKQSELTDYEETELDGYEEIDDYLSFLNRLTRNLSENESGEAESVS